MTIRDIIARGAGAAGSGQAWRVQRGECNRAPALELWHYSTRMLRWNPSDPSDPEVLDYSIGNGSVSDQGGMNTAFRVLGLPLNFDRDARGGGPRISDLPR